MCLLWPVPRRLIDRDAVILEQIPKVFTGVPALLAIGGGGIRVLCAFAPSAAT